MSEHSIGKTIANLRKSKGWTQVELAEKLNVSDKAVSKWESEAGFPEISQFPVMAKLFNVTIDYLMTGEMPTKEIVIMSKMELCAKNDDIKLLEGITLKTRDEHNKSIISYAKEYNSIKVLKEIICKYGFSDLIDGWRRNGRLEMNHFTQALCYAFNTGTFAKLKEEFDNLPFIGNVNQKDSGAKLWVYLSNLTEKDLSEKCFDKVFDMLVNQTDIHHSVYEFMFDRRQNETVIGQFCGKIVWRDGLTRLLQCALASKNYKMFDKYVEKIKQWDESSHSAIKEAELDKTWRVHYSYNIPLEKIKKENPLTGFDEKIIETLLKNEKIDLAEELHQHNITYKIPSIDADKIRIAKLKKEKKLSAVELQVQSAIHNGILSVNELLAINDFKIIKKSLYQYPIHISELLSILKKQGRRELLKFAIDSNDKELADMVLNDSLNTISQTNIGSYYAETLFDHILIKYWENDHRNNYANHINTTADMLKSLQERRDHIITDLSLKLDKEKTIGELTKEYFENELTKGNIEIVIIKLCVRMESILRCDYHYDGDFSEMLAQYCSKFNTYDDEDNNYDPYTPKILNKLRMQRNGIVHSEKSKDALTVNEIKWCIDYICNLG